MSFRFETVRDHAFSLIGALFFATLMIGVSTPLVPVA
jgi:hypothetical protein